MAIPLIAAALYGMAGYQNNKSRERDNERQDKADARQAKLDAQNAELHDARMQDMYQAQALRQDDVNFKEANKVAASAGKTDAGFQVTDSAGSNAFTKDADAAAMLGNMATAKNEGAQTNNASRVSTGRTGATMQGTVAGNQVFQDPAKAEAFAKTQAMGDYAKLKARQEVADEYGKMDLSDEIRIKMQKLESEGAFKAYSLAQSGDYEGAAKVYQSTGNGRLPEGAKFIGNEVEDPTTKTMRKVISIVGADRKPIVADVDQALRSYLSPEARYTMESKDRADVRDGRRLDIAEKNADTAEKRLGILESSKSKTTGINSDAIDGYLVPSLGSINADGNKVQANPAVINLVRNVAFQLPQASVDPKGAAYTAHLAWTKSLSAAGGDEQKAMILLNQALQPAATSQPAPVNTPTPSAATPPVRPQTMQSTLNTPTYTKLMQAKSEKDDLLSKASKMSKESAAIFLQSRLPQIESVIKANENYQVQ